MARVLWRKTLTVLPMFGKTGQNAKGTMKDQLESAVRKNIDWFLHSGIMRPNDGFWGVAERIADIGSNEAKEKIDRFFPQQTRITTQPGKAGISKY